MQLSRNNPLRMYEMRVQSTNPVNSLRKMNAVVSIIFRWENWNNFKIIVDIIRTKEIVISIVQ